jgi:hypothetical protein
MMTYLILVLQFVCLSLWVGGVTVILSVVTPSAFRLQSPEEADELMILILKRYNSLLAALQVFFLATLYLQLLLLSNSVSLKLRLALSLTALATLLTVYFRYTVLPRDNAARPGSSVSERSSRGGEEVRDGRGIRGRSMTLLTMNLFLGLCVVIILILPF